MMSLLHPESLETTTYHPAHAIVGYVLLRKSSQNHGLAKLETGGGAKNPHGLINLLEMCSTLLRHVAQRVV